MSDDEAHQVILPLGPVTNDKVGLVTMAYESFELVKVELSVGVREKDPVIPAGGETRFDSSPVALVISMCNETHGRIFETIGADNVTGRIGAPVVDDDDFPDFGYFLSMLDGILDDETDTGFLS